MTRKSTLDEFLDGGDDGRERSDAGDGHPGGAGSGSDGVAEPSDAPAVHEGEDPSGDAVAVPDDAPAAVTCEWTPDGAACEGCGATVERRWVDGDARVCADCKEW